jgi:hypothetical protein
MRQKIQAVKKKYKDKLRQLPKECSFCNNMVDLGGNLSNYTLTQDKVNASFDSNSFTTSKSFIQQQTVNGQPPAG